MAIDLPTDDTSVGPLDVEKRAGDEGDDLGPASFDEHGDENKILDPNAPANPYANSADSAADAEREHQKNPLGYMVTPPTEAELDEAE